jgi:hypothetical protein
VEGVKAFLTRQIGPFPIYAYAVGVLALIGGIWYFKSRGDTGQATPAPQTNYQADQTPYPYPDPGSGAPGLPPSAPFDVPSSSAIAQYSPQSNFVPASAQPTSSQDFAAYTAAVTQPAPVSYTPIYAPLPQISAPASSGGTSGLRQSLANIVAPSTSTPGGTSGLRSFLSNVVQTFTPAPAPAPAHHGPQSGALP